MSYTPYSDRLRYTLYDNTPENAAWVGWAHLGEYWRGDPKASHVIHDCEVGIFYFVNVEAPISPALEK